MINEIFTVRSAKEEDLPFVFNSWLNSFGKRNKKIKDYTKLQSIRMNTILHEDNCTLLVDTEEPSVIIGYVVWNHDTVHWLYVKKDFRNCKLSVRLLSEIGKLTELKYFSHQTHNSSVIGTKLGLIYNPFVLERYIRDEN